MNYTTKTVRILPRAADLPNYKLDTSDESDEEPAVDRNSPLLKSTAGAGNVPSGVYNNISLMEMLTKCCFEIVFFNTLATETFRLCPNFDAKRITAANVNMP